MVRILFPKKSKKIKLVPKRSHWSDEREGVDNREVNVIDNEPELVEQLYGAVDVPNPDESIIITEEKDLTPAQLPTKLPKKSQKLSINSKSMMMDGLSTSTLTLLKMSVMTNLQKLENQPLKRASGNATKKIGLPK